MRENEPALLPEPTPSKGLGGLPHHVYMQAQRAGYGQSKGIIKGWFKAEKERLKAEAKAKREKLRAEAKKLKEQEKAEKLAKKLAAKSIPPLSRKPSAPDTPGTMSLAEQKKRLSDLSAIDTANARAKLSADDRMKDWSK